MTDIELLAKAYQFAAIKHSTQRRKGEAAEPYINHLAEVAQLVAFATKGQDASAVAAAVLHDTIEDCDVTAEELAAAFNDDVAGLVQEVTDDKSLPYAERKRLQISNGPHKTPRARLIKIADKTSNLRSLAASPPADWSSQRRQDYLDWSCQVVAPMRGTHAELEAIFDAAASLPSA